MNDVNAIRAMEYKPHLALVPFPAQGHMPSVMYLARKLAESGFIVTVINIDSLHRKLSEQWSSPSGLDIRLEGVTCDVKMPEGMSSVTDTDLAMSAVDRLEVPVGELVGKLKPAPCCFVADYFLGWGARVAKSMNICPVTFFPANAAYSCLHHHFKLLVSRGDAFQDEMSERVIDYVPGIDPLKHEDLPHYFRKLAEEPTLTQRLLLESTVERMNDSEWTLVHSMIELERRTFKAMQESVKNYVSIGPLFPLTSETRLGVSLRDENYDCLKWLDTQADVSVLYISFGSISTLPDRAFEEFTAGLEASEQKFLMVARDEGELGRWNEFHNRTRQQGLVVSWAPQLKVLSHSSVGGFLSHCGWNSTFESICCGVPVLGCPMYSDQHLNCKLLTEDWKVGKLFSKRVELVKRKEVEEKVREFMQGEESMEMRSRVNALKDMASETLREGGASHTNLLKFVNAMLTCYNVKSPSRRP